MSRFIPRSKWMIASVLATAMAVAGGLYFGKDCMLAWYNVQRLIRANESEREIWVNRVAEADEAAISPLLNGMREPDPARCANASAGLSQLASRWPADDPRLSQLAVRMGDEFPRLNPTGQASALSLCMRWIEGDAVTSEFAKTAGRLTAYATHSTDKDVRSQALTLAAACLKKQPKSEEAASQRAVLTAGLQDSDAEIRARAARLCGTADAALLPLVAPLLDDPAPRVRQAALLAVGQAENAVCTDDLLRSLHDPDEDVRRLTEAALLSRGLCDEDVLLGRMISDARAGVRLQVLDRMGRSNELDLKVWLQRLTHDPSPAVRAAAIRAAANRSNIDLSDRLAQLSKDDPSPTVRQLAQHYLSAQKNRGAN